MLRPVFAALVAAHGAFQLFGAAVAFGLVDAERLYESLLFGGHLELASAGGTPVGVALLATGLAFALGAVAVVTRRGWALGVVGITVVVSMLVTGLGERSTSGVVVNTLLLIGLWQLWRSEPAWAFRT